jgi:hypothetical protein
MNSNVLDKSDSISDVEAFSFTMKMMDMSKYHTSKRVICNWLFYLGYYIYHINLNEDNPELSMIFGHLYLQIDEP